MITYATKEHVIKKYQMKFYFECSFHTFNRYATYTFRIRYVVFRALNLKLIGS